MQHDRVPIERLPSTAAEERRRRRPYAQACLVLLLVGAAEAPAESGGLQHNGFDLSSSAVPSAEILSGGPPRDGIPALEHPPHVVASSSPWPDDTFVLGAVVGEEARAYPLAILDWHELVNDTLGAREILVSYCPLCGTGIVYDRRVGGNDRHFGVSGLLYRSDLLMFDRETQSLWSQISATAITGPAVGQRLAMLRSDVLPWRRWLDTHPASTILSRETGHLRDYTRSPYGDYATSRELRFPARVDPRYHPKMPTIGMRLGSGAARAYPAAEVARAGGRVEDRIDCRRVTIRFDSAEGTFRVDAPADIEVVEGFWFAWMAFHPESTVYVAAPSDAGRGSGP
jgi:hypothetical protein